MRSRSVASSQQRGHERRELRADTGDSENDLEGAVKSSGEFDYDGENSTNRKRIAVLCLGVFVGVFLSSSMRAKKPQIALQTIHTNVKSAYRAHKKAKQDYLKAYREAYLGSSAEAAIDLILSQEDTNDDKVDDSGSAKRCWEKPDEKFCWNEGLSIKEHVDAQLHPWISKGGITPKDVERTRSEGSGVIRTDGSVEPSSFLPYIGRALKAYPELRPETEISIHGGSGDWQEHSMDRYMNASDGLPIIVSGSSYEAFLEIVIPWSYGGRDAFGEKYENAHKNVLEIGENSPEWSEKKSEAIWRGAAGCSVGCAKRGRLYFPSNYIEQCTDDKKGWDANNAGRTWGCEESGPALRHQRMQLVNISVLHGKECGLDARITAWNNHENTLRTAGMTAEELENFKGDRMGEEEQAKFKYIVNVQNNGFADRLWRILALKVVVLQEMHAFREFFYDMLIPWVHYVPIKTDLSDLCEKIQWAKDNDDKARIIAENAHEFVRNQLSLDNINLYVATLIHRIGELTVQGHNM